MQKVREVQLSVTYYNVATLLDSCSKCRSPSVHLSVCPVFVTCHNNGFTALLERCADLNYFIPLFYCRGRLRICWLSEAYIFLFPK